MCFIFDRLLPHTTRSSTQPNTTEPTKESKHSVISTLARQLLSVLGSYWHNVEIQNVFITELKGALTRTLNYPESKSKHYHLQSIFNLITSMIESAAPISFSSQPPLQNTSFVKLLIKRGLISDLARVTHNLDLSSHELVQTVNLMLKPLEKLSNLANCQNVQHNKNEKDANKENVVTTTTTMTAAPTVTTSTQPINTTLLQNQCNYYLIFVVFEPITFWSCF